MRETQRRARKARFGKFIWWLGILATGILVAALGQGFRVSAKDDLRVHIFLALAAALTMLFSHLWIVIYLRFLRREVRLHQETQDGPPSGEIPRARLLWSTVATAAVFGSFFLGPLGLVGEVPSGLHGVVGFLALAAQWMSLRGEKRDLAACDEVLLRLFAAEAAHLEG